jgi:hypothetical protein
MQQTDCAVFVKDDDAAIPMLNADHLVGVCKDTASWWHFLRMSAGGPPAAMTARRDNGVVEELMVIDGARVPERCELYEDAAKLP